MQELLAYDKAVEKAKKGDKLEYDATPEQLKVEREMCRTGTRQSSPIPKGTRKRKENATKDGIIEELAHFLAENSEFQTSDVEIVNKGREIHLKICGEWYSVVLTYKRNMNK